MNIEYKKDLRHNYLVISDDILQMETYSRKVLEHQTIEGFLSLQQRNMDNNTYLYYDITAKQSMTVLFEKARFTYEVIKNLCINILLTIERAFEYLLSEDDFILEPEYIYVELSTNKPVLCFLPGYSKDIRLQIVRFLEYVMNKVDYNDKEGVLLVYRLYAISKEESYTLDQLMQALMNKETIKPVLVNQCDKKVVDELKINKDEIEAPKQVVNKVQVSEKHIPIMVEKLEGEVEVLYYPIRTYLISGASILGCCLLFAICFLSGILYNSFGKRIDTTKLLAASLIILCIESYLLKIIWDKKNKISKLVTKHEYVDPRQLFSSAKEKEKHKVEFNHQGSINRINRNYNNIKHSTSKYNRDIKNKDIQNSGKQDSNMQSRDMQDRNMHNSNMQKSNNQNNNNSIYDQQIRDIHGKKEILKDYNLCEINTFNNIEEDNPTCLLNAISPDMEIEAIQDVTVFDKEIQTVLNPVDELHFQPIILNSIPFFVGKLKKNVDYSLEKDVVSRYHAKIYKEEEQYYISDLNSTNGTFVNGEVLMPYQNIAIQFNDEIAFANIHYRFERIG